MSLKEPSQGVMRKKLELSAHCGISVWYLESRMQNSRCHLTVNLTRISGHGYVRSLPCFQELFRSFRWDQSLIQLTSNARHGSWQGQQVTQKNSPSNFLRIQHQMLTQQLHLIYEPLPVPSRYNVQNVTLTTFYLSNKNTCRVVPAKIQSPESCSSSLWPSARATSRQAQTASQNAQKQIPITIRSTTQIVIIGITLSQDMSSTQCPTNLRHIRVDALGLVEELRKSPVFPIQQRVSRKTGRLAMNENENKTQSHTVSVNQLGRIPTESFQNRVPQIFLRMCRIIWRIKRPTKYSPLLCPLLQEDRNSLRYQAVQFCPE